MIYDNHQWIMERTTQDRIQRLQKEADQNRLIRQAKGNTSYTTSAEITALIGLLVGLLALVGLGG